MGKERLKKHRAKEEMKILVSENKVLTYWSGTHRNSREGKRQRILIFRVTNQGGVYIDLGGRKLVSKLTNGRRIHRESLEDGKGSNL